MKLSSISESKVIPLRDAGALHVPAMMVRGGVLTRNCGNHLKSQSHRNGLFSKFLCSYVESEYR